MNIRTHVISVEHLDEVRIVYSTKIKRVLAFEFFNGYSGDKMCRLVCEVK